MGLPCLSLDLFLEPVEGVVAVVQAVRSFRSCHQFVGVLVQSRELLLRKLFSDVEIGRETSGGEVLVVTVLVSSDLFFILLA